MAGRKKTAKKYKDGSLAVRVKTAKGRKISSTLWLKRQLNDPYVRQAKMDGWRSRAAYKLLEIDKKVGLLKKNMRVVDLGCAPGGWCQVLAKVVDTTDENPKIVGMDFLAMDAIAGVRFLQKDFTEEDAPNMLRDVLGGHRIDLVLCDMAAPTTGHKATDHLRIVHLVELAADFAIKVLKPGGAFVAKVFQGGTEHELLALLKRHFTPIHHIKPPASRPDSAETYLVALGFKGKTQIDDED